MEIDKSQGVRVFYDSICLVLLITAVSAAILPWIISIDYVYVLIIGLMLLTAIINLSITFYRVRISVLKSEVWLNIIRPLIFLFCIIGIATFSSSLDAEVMLLAHLLALLLSLILILTIISPFRKQICFFSIERLERDIQGASDRLLV